MHLTKLLHASCALLPSFSLLPLLSARHSDVASSRGPFQPRPAPRSRDDAPCGALRRVGGAFAEACRGWRGWRWRGRFKNVSWQCLYLRMWKDGAPEDSFDEGL
ncbi:hypothetical protein JB92DRAFT_3036067 [Gautieria morchelliformis]|nr:hypothetical protein JB92DRAFT_3036067 [Gautieria morchelliformis]